MSWIAVGVAVGSALFNENRKRSAEEDAEEQARKDAEKARREAAEEELFAKEEGQGTGSVGDIQLAIDDELEDEFETRSGRSTTRI